MKKGLRTFLASPPPPPVHLHSPAAHSQEEEGGLRATETASRGRALNFPADAGLEPPTLEGQPR